MRTRLRDAKNKGIGGKGTNKIAYEVVMELTKYYGLAIGRHSNSVHEMKNTIWATYYYECSTDHSVQVLFSQSLVFSIQLNHLRNA